MKNCTLFITTISITFSFSECLDKAVNEDVKIIYNNCLEIIQAIEKEHRVAKICIGVGVLVLLVVIVLGFVYFCFIRNKRNNTNNSKNNKSTRLDAQPDGPLLLNNHSKSFAANL